METAMTRRSARKSQTPLFKRQIGDQRYPTAVLLGMQVWRLKRLLNFGRLEF
jgi:hypothetical protein